MRADPLQIRWLIGFFGWKLEDGRSSCFICWEDRSVSLPLFFYANHKKSVEMEVALEFHGFAFGRICFQLQWRVESCEVMQLLISGAHFIHKKVCVVAHPLKVKQQIDWKMLSIKSSIRVTKSHAL